MFVKPLCFARTFADVLPPFFLFVCLSVHCNVTLLAWRFGFLPQVAAFLPRDFFILVYLLFLLLTSGSLLFFVFLIHNMQDAFDLSLLFLLAFSYHLLCSTYELIPHSAVFLRGYETQDVQPYLTTCHMP